MGGIAVFKLASWHIELITDDSEFKEDYYFFFGFCSLHVDTVLVYCCTQKFYSEIKYLCIFFLHITKSGP